ncbi:hypothetical protein ASPNIDRAFT_37741 [Aspergillus niger ATCC 1015]|uniref:Uncharacterized protein n=1 Tax=Aspergillus niger (strain ATCC 1015 / CBS 113.46 / FGSC A1144 / LSHB Ac4 / NCTC 3858a / NRRL 328 / USDA 3528.7) TaxID=380704 RepID=G3YGM3_ASPNA|nr:hypothetical protein ASPNIDRAFT_37741 [Aspergillus niger ATCC 1015]
MGGLMSSGRKFCQYPEINHPSSHAMQASKLSSTRRNIYYSSGSLTGWYEAPPDVKRRIISVPGTEASDAPMVFSWHDELEGRMFSIIAVLRCEEAIRSHFCFGLRLASKTQCRLMSASEGQIWVFSAARASIICMTPPVAGKNSNTAEPGRDHNPTNPAIFHITTPSRGLPSRSITNHYTDIVSMIETKSHVMALAWQMKPPSHHPESAEATAKARRLPQTRGRCLEP